MKQPLVVDASVAVKWLLNEPDRDAALSIQDAYQEGRTDLIAPRLLIPEVGNVLWKHQQRGTIDEAALAYLFHGFLRDCPILIDRLHLHERAVELAATHKRSVYDCEYLALALDEGCDLITADRRFYDAVHPRFACVRLLGR